MVPVELLGYLFTGAFAGLLAGLFGIGGGVVMVPALMVLFGAFLAPSEWTPHQAVATSLAVVIGTNLVSTWAHQRRGAVHWQVLAWISPGLIAGAWLGGLAAAVVPGLWLQRMFGSFLLYVSVLMWQQRTTEGVSERAESPWRLPAAGVGIGGLSALLGIGGGTLTVPFLVSRGEPMRRAVGTSSACGVPIAVFGVIGFVWSGLGRAGLPAHSLGFVYWPAALALLVGSLPLAPLGAALAHRLPTALLKRAFAVLLVLIALRLLLGSG